MRAAPTTAPVTQPKVNARVAVVCVCVCVCVQEGKWGGLASSLVHVSDAMT